ncbi:hypothetical protein O7606_18050 [Micromonospora sp. WMMD882]|uniref:multiple cyclophane-containing RiPP AmcA n=1 Tax=Micromonospora sp. WMMD882 TaxID=3015151 RepID=UPI00248CB18F|nr:multiple cyclophane-containing RiPP AmcA [Micromonospora sp. WMMD882]WBB78138.1 hypothetical protein O7606_18050 [Micromonospora sp. WMMD882]
MPEITSHRQPERAGGTFVDPVAERVRDLAAGLTALLDEAEAARRLRAEVAGASGVAGSDGASEVAGSDGASAVCAWNHFENIPTFYNWNNRPR